MSFDLGTMFSVPVLLSAALLLLLVVVLWYAAQAARPRPVGPSGPPTGAAAMERKVASVIFMSGALFLIFAGYALREPARQADAREKLLDVSVGRGVGLYTQLCFSCHGEEGQGAVVPDSSPERIAPPLNRADLRPTDPDERQKRYDFIYKTIQRGRPNTPMPAWGQTDGGALFHEQLDNLTLMILNGERTIAYEGRTDTVWGHAKHIVEEHVHDGTAKMPQQPQVENLPFYQALSDQEKTGVRVLLQRGCGSCHVIPNLPGAAGTVGPSLEGIGSRPQIAGGAVPNTSIDQLAKWIMDPQELKPGTAMPDLGLSEQEARDAAAYLWTLK